MTIDRVVAAWPWLPCHIKAAIHALIDAAPAAAGGAQSSPDAGSASPLSSTTARGARYMLAVDIALENDLPQRTTRRALMAWRESRFDGWYEIHRRRSRDLRHLYAVDVVMPLIERMANDRVADD